jgi:hypothetical protein
MESVVAQFVIDPYAYERCATDPQRKSENVNEGKTFLAEKISNSDFDVVTDHMKAGLSG